MEQKINNYSREQIIKLILLKRYNATQTNPVNGDVLLRELYTVFNNDENRVTGSFKMCV